MVNDHPDGAYWAGMDRIMSHVVHAVAGLSGSQAVFKGGSHLRLCMAEPEDLPWYRFSEDLDFEWTGSDWTFWEMFDQALNIAAGTSGWEIGWGSRGDRFWWRSAPPDTREAHIKIDYRERGNHQIGWYEIWNPENGHTLPPTTILGFTPQALAYDKIGTLASTRRVKARDVYDLWFLSEYGYVNLAGVWGEWNRERGWDPQALADEIIGNQLCYYIEDWREGLAKGIYPTAATQTGSKVCSFRCSTDWPAGEPSRPAVSCPPVPRTTVRPAPDMRTGCHCHRPRHRQSPGFAFGKGSAAGPRPTIRPATVRLRTVGRRWRLAGQTASAVVG